MVSTRLKNISQIGSFPRVGVKMKNIWNHHLDKGRYYSWQGATSKIQHPPFSPWVPGTSVVLGTSPEQAERNHQLVVKPKTHLENLKYTGDPITYILFASEVMFQSSSENMTGLPEICSIYIYIHSCWFQSIWRICSSILIISPRFGVKIENVWVATT